MVLLRVLLVSFSSRGHQLVFSYPEEQNRDKDNSIILGFDSAFLADILSPKASLCDQKFHLRVQETEFIGHPTLLNVDRPGTGLIYSRMVQKKILERSNLSPLTMFHLVFAMNNCEKDEIDLVYEHTLVNITACLKYEQLRRGYVRDETETILNLKDLFSRGMASFPDLMEETLKQSSLAYSMMQIYKAMHKQTLSHMVINNSARLSIQSDLDTLRLVGKPILFGTFKTPIPALRPYQGILLLFESDQIIKNLLPDSSPLLIRFIQSITPISSFEQMQTILDCTLSQIYRLAAHLHYWGQAKIIQTISTRNFYVVSDDSDFKNFEPLSTEFSNRFPPLSLPTILSDISFPRPYHTIIPTKEMRPLYLDAMAFLMRKSLIVQLYIYLFLKVPDVILEKAKAHGDSSLAIPDAPFVIPDPSNPSPSDAECIRLLKESRHSPVIRDLFTRLLPYLNGKSHLEEILYEENMTKKELKSVMNAYKEEIITTLHG